MDLNGVRVRRARESEIPEIARIDASWTGHPAPRGCVWWVIRTEAGELAAYAGARVQGDHVRLTRAWVAPGARGERLQVRLIRARVAWALRSGYTVIRTYTWAGNILSIRNLQRAGFLAERYSHHNGTDWIWWKKHVRR